MREKISFTWKICVLFLLSLGSFEALAQCALPELYDLTYANPSSSQTWIHCIDNETDPDTYNLELMSPHDVQNYTIDFGDGSAVVSGALWSSNTVISHLFGLGKFTITLSETKSGCTKKTITSTFINDRKAGAAALPPTIGASTCAPNILSFKNTSTNTSAFTKFEWSWGDGTKDVVDASNSGQVTSHIYKKGTSSCNMIVRLTATGLCDASFASYGPFNFWDTDSAIISASVQQICGADSVTFKDVSKYNCNNKQARKIKWISSDLGISTPWLQATPVNKSLKAFITGPPGAIYNITLLDSNFCGVNQTSMKVEVIDPPVSQFTASTAAICSGDSVLFQNTSTGGANRFKWNFGDGTGWIENNNPTLYHKYSIAGNYTIKMASVQDKALGCSDTSSSTVSVLGLPQANFTFDKPTGCGKASVLFKNTSVNTSSFTWDFGNGTTQSGAGPWTIDFEPGYYSVKLVGRNSLNCISERSAAVIVPSDISLNISSDPVCLGDFNVFKNLTDLMPAVSCATGSILREQWDNITGAATVATLTANVNFPNKPSRTSLLTNYFEGPVNIGDNYGSRIYGFICPPVDGIYTFWISSNGDSELWLSSSAKVSDKTKIAYVSGTTTLRQWNRYISQQSLPVFLKANQRYYIEALHKESNLDDHLSVGWQLPDGTFERPIPAKYLSPYMPGTEITSWSWTFGDGGSASVKEPVHLYDAPGSYEVIIEAATDVCKRKDTIYTVVSPLPVPSFDSDKWNGCTPFDLKIANKSQNTFAYDWSFGDGSPGLITSDNLDTITHTYLNKGSDLLEFPLKLIAKSDKGCMDTLIQIITVYPDPVADFLFTPQAPQCSPSNIKLANNSSLASSFKWTIQGKDTIVSSMEFNHTFVNKTGIVKDESVSIRAITDHGCFLEKSKTIIVYPEPEFKIEAKPKEGCHPLIVGLSSEGAQYKFNWDFGDGFKSSSSTPIHVFNNITDKDTLFRISLNALSSFNCSATVYDTVIVHPKPEADFNESVSFGCSPLSVRFSNSSQKAGWYKWDFGDGVLLDTLFGDVSHVFENKTGLVKEFYVKLISGTDNNCADTLIRKISVFPEVFPDFVGEMEGCSPFKTKFAPSGSLISNYTWDFGDGSTSLETSPVHIFQNSSAKDTVFNVILKVKSVHNCDAEITKPVAVWAGPEAKFTVASTTIQLPDSAIYITNNTVAGDFEIKWDFGDGSNSIIRDPQVHYYGFYGNYKLTLSLNTGKCTSTFTRDISVLPTAPIASFTGEGEGCLPLEISFNNTSKFAEQYLWEFGDGETSVLKNPKHNYGIAGDYSVRLSAKGLGGENYLLKDSIIHVRPVPVAYFIAQPKIVFIPDPIFFNNKSTNAIKYIWDFGDLTSSIDVSPSHVYKTSGRYKVKLTAENEFGCINIYELDDAVIAEEGGSIEIPNAFTPNHGGSNGGRKDGSGLNEVFYPRLHDVAEFYMGIYNKWGEMLFETRDSSTGWDGYYKNQLCPEDVYVYRIKVKMPSGKVKEYAGDITLIW
ncbi:PKD domain-containing protein [Sporocytophaga myxococcoides]|uniref:PKD domain-containing protein n=1 Tax=Sporocytophaga myxococcoides TaxID=153721 RepID=UPI00041CA25E|nr:PKD domain-containing protein [Sporocytophaga myxococcoides]